MFSYWIKNRFLFTFVLTALIAILIGFFFVVPNIKNESENSLKTSVYENTSIDFENDIGEPGEFPYTRGVRKNMYRGRFWTMRQYAGFATAEESNARYKYLLSQGTTGLSVAFDLPTQIGLDSDDSLAAGEVDHLVAERVWQELAKGLMEKKPSRMIETLRECGALARLIAPLDRLFGVPQRADYHPEIDTGVHVMMALDHSAQHDYALPVRFAVLLHDLGKGVTPAADLPRHPGHEARSTALVKEVCEQLKVPAECRDLALLMARYHGDIRRGPEMRAATIDKLLTNCDALRRPQRFGQLLEACACDYHGRLGWEDKPIPEPELFPRALAAARSIDAAEIAGSCSAPAQIPERLHSTRTAAIKEALNLTH